MIIACDTSSSICSVALVDDGQVIERWETTGAQVHIEKLTPYLGEAFERAGERIGSIEALALAIGPGSFNGLRIGLASIKGLALARSLPVIPVSSMDGLAYSAGQELTGRARGVIFSHRDLVHYADYTLGEDRTITTPEFHYGKWDELTTEEVAVYFGNPERGFKDWLESESGYMVQSNFHPVQADAGAIGLLAEQRMDQATMALDELEPLYNAHYEAKKWIPPKF